MPRKTELFNNILTFSSLSLLRLFVVVLVVEDEAGLYGWITMALDSYRERFPPGPNHCESCSRLESSS